MFVADDLGAWLVTLLADASRRKVTDLVLGSQQQRALRTAADAAIQLAAGQLSTSAGADPEQVAMVVGEVFRQPVPRLCAGQQTLLEALQAGIARQLKVLEDAELTGTSQSAATVLGVPDGVIAEVLTGQLIREIVLTGARGGPLTPLAAQLNYDLLHQQGQRLEGTLAGLAAELRGTSPASGITRPVGWPLTEVTDPFALEVHRPVQPDHPSDELPLLPDYVPREHDTALTKVVTAAAAGTSGIAALVGGSSTGKTRACWQALDLLRERQPQWRLWHPIDPTRPEAALAELPAIGPRTVVWLNEAQFYLAAPGGLGEHVAAGLRELLRNPARGPVLVLATLWPQFWDELTSRPRTRETLDNHIRAGSDEHAQARELLTGHDIALPTAFSPAQVRQLRQADDPRLTAAAIATDGRVIQYLAGAPELLARYQHAPAAAKAVIEAAMDAHRLGMRAALPHAFLRAAAPGYLADTDWDQLGEDWLEQALDYAAQPCKGAMAVLTCLRTRPAPQGQACQISESPNDGRQRKPMYRLADYLDQHGRRDRAAEFPPPQFWAAAAEHANPADQAALGRAARARGLYCDAAQLCKNATHVSILTAQALLQIMRKADPTDRRPALWVATHVPLDDYMAEESLRHDLGKAANDKEVITILARRRRELTLAPRRHPRPVQQLKASTSQQHTKPARAANPPDPLSDPGAAAMLLDSLREADNTQQAETLAARAASTVPVDSMPGMVRLLKSLHDAGITQHITTLLDRAAAHTPLDHPGAVAGLLDTLREAGTSQQVATLLARDPAAHAPLDNPRGVAWLLGSLREAGATQQFTALATRAAAQSSLDDPGGVARLLDNLWKAGTTQQLTTLLARDPASHTGLYDQGRAYRQLETLQQVGATQQAETLTGRLPAAGFYVLHPHCGEPRYRFGRNPDGQPADQWNWDSLS